MDAKITLSFNEEIINKAKKFAEKHNISLSRLTEVLYQKITSSNYKNLEEISVSSWVNEISTGEVEYKKKRASKKSLKREFYTSRK